jgi:AhpD family alkylhydroperoxidase
MKTKLSVVVALLALPALAAAPNPEADAARAEIQKMFGFVPDYLKAVPDSALPGAWEEMKTLHVSDTTALSCKVKELIGVAVAAQLPNRSVAYGHSKFARFTGATEAEVSEAVVMAGLTRHWSTFFNGIQLDEAKFRAEIKMLVENAKKGMASGKPPPAPIKLTDGKSALKDIEQSFGFVPEFARKFPEASFAGAWRQMRDVEMNPSTALPGKVKSLIGIAVAAQIPCHYCLIADTEFAKLEGASDQEIAEAVAMGGLVRYWATLIDGMQVDEAGYKRDIEKIVKNLSAKTAKAR